MAAVMPYFQEAPRNYSPARSYTEICFTLSGVNGPPILGDDFDRADDVPIEVVEVFGGTQSSWCCEPQTVWTG